MDLRDSYLRCPRDRKRLVIDPLDEEGQAVVTHRCLECTYAVRAPGQPRRTPVASPSMTALRQRMWGE